MCGILGYVTKGVPAIDRFDRKAALRALGHRGPDGNGFWEESPGPEAVALLHTRLAILDPSEAGRQPMTSVDGHLVLTFNGEIYNYQELRDDLARHGDRFQTGTDTEVLLAAFARWGEAAIPRLRGMFAFAIWDRRDRRLTLVRDRLGIKPLYYTEVAGGLAFASEVRALMAAGLAERRLSREGLESFLAFGSVWGPQTMVDGVRELSAGGIATWTQGRFEQRKYWELPLPSSTGPKSREEAVEAITPILLEAVKLQLRSDVPLGIFLSAGIDSSVLALLAGEALPRSVVTLTVSFDGPEDEGDAARKIARELGTDHREARISSAEAALLVPAAVESMDQPSIDGINTWLVSRAARGAGLKVALSGLGGDELFAGYSSFRRFPAMLRMGRLLRAPGRMANAILGGVPFNAIPPAWRKAVAIAAAGGDPTATYGVLRALFLPEQAAALSSGRRGLASSVRPEAVDEDPVNTLSRLELGHYLRYTLLRDTDAMSLAHGLEVRPPILDERLVEAVVPMSGWLKLSSDGNKPLLRGAAAQLPAWIGRRAKTGFSLPFAQWMEGPLRDWLAEGTAASPLRLPPGIHRLGWSRRLAPAILGHWMKLQRCEGPIE
ncbi:MAG: asparagine synthase (glutamine-hydrolyzing) [Deltaproteobacteria bacterium]